MSRLRRPLNSGSVLIPKSVTNQLAAARLKHLPKETGGYLIGRRRGPHLEITGATYQGPDDIATRATFDRADVGHTRAAVEAWRRDSGLSGVVGDWHSHPSGDGGPSATDEHAWRTLARAEGQKVVDLILAEAGMTIHLALRRFSRPQIILLALLEETAEDMVFGLR